METEYLGMSGLQIGIQWFFIAICMGLIISSPFFLLELRRSSRKMKVEMREIVDDVINFHAELSYVDALRYNIYAAREKIKAICGHLGVQVEIVDIKMNPSIDIMRSLSFMKEYLPEIEEQWEIYEEKCKESRIILDKIQKKREWIIQKLYKTTPYIWNLLNSEQKRQIIQKLYITKPYIWNLLNFEQKRQIIQNLSEKYDREHKESQK